MFIKKKKEGENREVNDLVQQLNKLKHILQKNPTSNPVV